MKLKTAGYAKDGTRILQQPRSKKGNISMAQARKAVRMYREKTWQKPSA